MADPNIHALLGLKGEYKARSHKTFHDVHIPEINRILASAQDTSNTTASTTIPTSPTDPSLEVILIGDSMLEQFRTTGRSPHTQISSRSHTFNAGVGGDKIENVFIASIRAFYNDYNPLHRDYTRALEPSEFDNYALLLRALLSVSPSDTQVLAVAIFRRKDIGDAVVRASNLGIQEVVKAVNMELGNERIWFLEQPEELTKARLQDHVHLDRDGYKLWNWVLLAKIERIIDGMRGTKPQCISEKV